MSATAMATSKTRVEGLGMVETHPTVNNITLRQYLGEYGEPPAGTSLYVLLGNNPYQGYFFLIEKVVPRKGLWLFHRDSCCFSAFTRFFTYAELRWSIFVTPDTF